MNVMQAVTFCRRMNARVRYHSNGTVSVGSNGRKCRRKTLAAACVALEIRLARLGVNFAALGST